jgi:hypothetical protein
MFKINLPLITLISLLMTSNAYADTRRCSAQPLSEDQVEIPKLEIGSQWTYIVGNPEDGVTLHLRDQVDGLNIYRFDSGEPHQEIAETITDVVPSRKGSKTVIKFPLSLGQTWEDEFTETGELRSEYESYTYDYHEKSVSKVAAIEEVEVSAGTFTTFRIDRVAHWSKSNPVMGPDSEIERDRETDTASLSGVTLTQIWYAPVVGRGVLKAWMVAGHESYLSDLEKLLEYGNASVVELQRFENSEIHCSGENQIKSRYAQSPIPTGFKVRRNNTWEWAFQMRPHISKSN